MSDDTGFRLEVLKLLLQVAWADGEVDPKEANMIFALARRWQLPEAELARIEQATTSGGPLPAPNLGVLKTRKAQALELARTLVDRDGTISGEEADMLEQIASLLG